jgi:hypothetical protein
LLTGTSVFLFGYRPRSIVGSGYSRSISAEGSWRPYLLVFRVWLIRSLTPPKTELPATIANRRPKVEKYRGKFLRLQIRFQMMTIYILKNIFKYTECVGRNARVFARESNGEWTRVFLSDFHFFFSS